MSWFSRLFTRPGPTRREMSAQQNVLDGLEARVEYVHEELKKLRGRVYATERGKKGIEDAPGSTTEEPDISQHPRAPTSSTAHLARRFKGV